jgi:ATP-dependent Clp protease protease subunit
MGAGYSIKSRAGSGEATIYLYEDIGDSFFGGVSAKQFADDLKALGNVSTINLRLNSPGGDVFDGTAIYRLLIDHPARVIAHVDGLAASIASVIAMAADEIRISEAGFLMIHNASGLVVGEAKDMRQMADTLDTVTNTISDVYVARTKNDPTAVQKWMDDETWFTAADAVENGFADTVVQNMRVAAYAAFDQSRYKFKHTPTVVNRREEAKPIIRPLFDAAAARIAAHRAQVALRKNRELRTA